MERANETKDKKRKKFKFGYIKLFTAVILAYFIYTVYDQQTQINKYNSQISMYEADIGNKEGLVDYYKSQKSNMQSDAFIEFVARDQLGYVKPYEKIFVDVNK